MKPKSKTPDLASLRFSLRPIAPFRLDFTAWAIHRRKVNVIDSWDGKAYRRVINDGDTPVLLTAQSGERDSPRLHVTVTAQNINTSTKSIVVAALNRLLGLQVNLSDFYKLSNRDPNLRKLADRFRGLKPPRFLSVFEAVANGIACQQLSVTVGITLLSRLAIAYGPHIQLDGSVYHAFPSPSDLSNAKEVDLRKLGFSTQKAKYLLNVVRRIVCGDLDLEELNGLENEEAVERLLAIHGVGRWTAEYVLLRGLGRLNTFPGDDVGAQNNLARWLRLKGTLDYDRVRSVLKKWEPYTGLTYFHLLLSRLEVSGALGESNRSLNQMDKE